MAVTTSSGNGFALYNGIKLPNIDTVWANKETYLYAFVTYTVLSADVAMYDVRFATTEYGYNGSRFYPVNDGTYVSFTTPANQATVDWINANGGNVSLGVWRESGSGSLVASRAVKLDMRWHSFDIEDFGDATFPIPLDGMTVIEWDGVTDGNSIEIQAGYSIQRIGDYLPANVYGGFVTSNTAADSNPITIYGSPSGSYSSIPDVYTAKADIFENDSWLVKYTGDELTGYVNALLSVKGNLPMTASVTVSEGLWAPVVGLNGSIAMYTPLVAYRSADTPSEPTYDRTAFLSGMAMGLCGKGYPAGANGHMSYNGVELADINSIWTDKSNHVFICKAVNSYFAIVSTVAPYQDSVNGGVSLSAPFYFKQYGCFTDEAAANEYGTTAYTWTFYQEHSLDEGVSNFDQTVIWTSTDIRKDSDGSMFLAASEPFPAGGISGDDDFSKGYLVGAELRRKRALPESSGVYDDTWPVEWTNALTAGNNPSVIEGRFVKASNLTPTPEEMAECVLEYTFYGEIGHLYENGIQVYDNFFTIVFGDYAVRYYVVTSAGYSADLGITFPETGIYVTNYGINEAYDNWTLRKKST